VVEHIESDGKRTASVMDAKMLQAYDLKHKCVRECALNDAVELIVHKEGELK
jgi:hypothetical protein